MGENFRGERICVFGKVSASDGPRQRGRKSGGRLRYYYEDDLSNPHADIKADVLSKVIKQATDSAPGPDGVRYYNVLYSVLTKHNI